MAVQAVISALPSTDSVLAGHGWIVSGYTQ